jgi:hypothetical protein
MKTEELSFEEVLQELMLANAKPHYDTLWGWLKKYPQYRFELQRFFVAWAMLSHAPEPTVEIDEDEIVKEGVAHAMAIVRKQGLVLPKTEMPALQPFDQLVLAAADLLHGAGNGLNITEKVSEMSGKIVLMGTVYEVLSRLERQHLLSVRRQNNRRHFTITPSGERVLAHAKATSTVFAPIPGGVQ